LPGGRPRGGGGARWAPRAVVPAVRGPAQERDSPRLADGGRHDRRRLCGVEGRESPAVLAGALVAEDANAVQGQRLRAEDGVEDVLPTPASGTNEPSSSRRPHRSA